MINADVKERVMNTLTTEVEDRRTRVLADLDLKGFMKSGALDLVKQSVEKIRANVIASIPEGVAVPGTSLYVSCTGSGDNLISVVNISLNNKIKSEKKFKYSMSFTEDDIVNKILDFFVEAYTQLIVDDMAEQNVAELNKVLKEVTKSAGLDYSVSLATVIGGSDSKIGYISDDEVVFNVDLNRIFGVDKVTADMKSIASEDNRYLIAMLTVREPDESCPVEAIEEAKGMIAESISAAQTPVQLVAQRGGEFIAYFCGINNNMKPINLIKKVCNRDIKKISGSKDAIGYYADEKIYSLIAKRDGNYEVILSPFDTETFRAVDMDVIKAIA